jgi:hypothetical protein
MCCPQLEVLRTVITAHSPAAACSSPIHHVCSSTSDWPTPGTRSPRSSRATLGPLTALVARRSSPAPGGDTGVRAEACGFNRHLPANRVHPILSPGFLALPLLLPPPWAHWPICRPSCTNLIGPAAPTNRSSSAHAGAAPVPAPPTLPRSQRADTCPQQGAPSTSQIPQTVAYHACEAWGHTVASHLWPSPLWAAVATTLLCSSQSAAS